MFGEKIRLCLKFKQKNPKKRKFGMSKFFEFEKKMTQTEPFVCFLKRFQTKKRSGEWVPLDG